jgi:TonB family protein|nr:energy transducer TonB [Candidatus Acidoferrales bacterium]
MRTPAAIATALFLASASLVALAQTPTSQTRMFRSAEVVTASGVPIPFNSVANGIVELHLTISATGTVDEVRIARPLASVTEQAVSAVKTWTFTPATMRGKPIASRLTVAVVFCPSFGFGAGEIPLPPLLPESAKEAAGSGLPPVSPEIISAQYPVDSGTQVKGGTVVLRVLVGADGQPGLVRIVKDAAPMTSSARTAVAGWKFRPARMNGKEAISGYIIAFRFRTPSISN